MVSPRSEALRAAKYKVIATDRSWHGPVSELARLLSTRFGLDQSEVRQALVGNGEVTVATDIGEEDADLLRDVLARMGITAVLEQLEAQPPAAQEHHNPLANNRPQSHVATLLDARGHSQTKPSQPASPAVRSTMLNWAHREAALKQDAVPGRKPPVEAPEPNAEPKEKGISLGAGPLALRGQEVQVSGPTPLKAIPVIGPTVGGAKGLARPNNHDTIITPEPFPVLPRHASKTQPEAAPAPEPPASSRTRPEPHDTSMVNNPSTDWETFLASSSRTEDPLSPEAAAKATAGDGAQAWVMDAVPKAQSPDAWASVLGGAPPAPVRSNQPEEAEPGEHTNRWEITFTDAAPTGAGESEPEDLFATPSLSAEELERIGQEANTPKHAPQRRPAEMNVDETHRDSPLLMKDFAVAVNGGAVSSGAKTPFPATPALPKKPSAKPAPFQPPSVTPEPASAAPVLTNASKASAHSPRTAGLLSTFIPGAGQVYNGQLTKGIIYGCASILIVPWVLGIRDAVQTARSISEGLQRGKNTGQSRTVALYGLAWWPLFGLALFGIFNLVQLAIPPSTDQPEPMDAATLKEATITARGEGIVAFERALYRATRAQNTAAEVRRTAHDPNPGEPGYGLSLAQRQRMARRSVSKAQGACSRKDYLLCKRFAQEAIQLSPTVRGAFHELVRAQENLGQQFEPIPLKNNKDDGDTPSKPQDPIPDEPVAPIDPPDPKDP